MTWIDSACNEEASDKEPAEEVKIVCEEQSCRTLRYLLLNGLRGYAAVLPSGGLRTQWHHEIFVVYRWRVGISFSTIMV